MRTGYLDDMSESPRPAGCHFEPLIIWFKGDVAVIAFRMTRSCLIAEARENQATVVKRDTWYLAVAEDLCDDVKSFLVHGMPVLKA